MHPPALFAAVTSYGAVCCRHLPTPSEFLSLSYLNLGQNRHGWGQSRLSRDRTQPMG